MRPAPIRPEMPIDLAGTHLKGHVADFARAAQALHRQGRTTDRARAHVDVLAQLATDHQGDQLLTVVIGHRLDAHQLAVAQYRNALGNTGQLFEAMRNIDDRHAPGLQAGDLLEQHLDFTGGEHGRGLVEDQYMAVADQVTGDLDHLLVTDAQLADERIRIDRVKADLGHGFDRGFAQLLAADPAAVAGQVVEKQVFRHRQGRQQVEFLHDHAHAQVLQPGCDCRDGNPDPGIACGRWSA